MRRLRLLPLILLGVVPWVGGCNIVGPIFAVAHGPPTQEAQFVFEDLPTVVYVDDRNEVIAGSSQTIRRTIAERISQELMIGHDHQQQPVLTTTIRPTDAMGVAESGDRSDRLMPMDEIARRVGADQLIYVDVLQFSLGENEFAPNPIASASVRVLDVVARERLFPPPGSPPWEIQATLGNVNSEMLDARSARIQLADALAELLGVNISQLFYKHEPTQLGGRLGSR